MTTSAPMAGKGRLGERAANRVRDAARSYHAITFVVALLVVARLATYVLSLIFLEMGADQPLRVTQSVAGFVSTMVDVVVLFVVLILFEARRRIDVEADRVQTFMDSVYRRGF